MTEKVEDVLERMKPAGSTVSIVFENPKAAEHFLLWLCEAGEQDYWEWMRRCERDEPVGNITAQFNYHEPGHGTVTAMCGRIDKNE